jgi:predicted flap endonuclease-1-like 5' DNA nuclease
VLEKKLNRLGLRTYRQIAALDKDEVEKLADRLGLTSERIRREGWIASAKSVLRANGE